MTSSIHRFLMLALILASLAATSASGEENEDVQAVRVFLDAGNPEQAISTAETLLNNTAMKPSERMKLLLLIANAETIRSRSSHYQDVTAAVQALDTMLKEFPDHPDAADFRWRRASLLWHGGHMKQATSALRNLLAKDQQPQQQRRAWLLMARIHLQQNHLALARSDLLQYGLKVNGHKRDQAIGLCWMAIVDWREKRTETAFDSLNTVYQTQPDIITSEPEFYATYIHLLNRHGQYRQAMHHANSFLNDYITQPQAAAIRLIRADLLARNSDQRATAIKEYAILAQNQAETIIGRQAFMRKLMLENSNTSDKGTLLSIMAALKKLADRNQLSVIEDEASLDLARLWTRITDSTKPLPEIPPALMAYSHATASHDAAIKSMALAEGSQLMAQFLQARLNNRQWLQAVQLWRTFPQLRSSDHATLHLHYGIAHAMRKLMLFDQADSILKHLYQQNNNSLRGERIMTEQIKLWRDRGDKDAVEKSMRWLNAHAYSIYRPEILAIVAQIQLQQNHIEAARQTLNHVRATDLALESRAAFWQTKATIAEKQRQWYSASKAWQHYRKSQGANNHKGLRHEAKSLFKAGEYAQAKKIWLQISEEKRDSEWQYSIAICQLHSGQLREAVELLQKVVDSKQTGTYVTLAKLALADQLASRLLKAQP